jgi:hypothetical protein
LAFWFHLVGDILYHRNLLAKRGFFIFCIPISFLGIVFLDAYLSVGMRGIRL